MDVVLNSHAIVSNICIICKCICIDMLSYLCNVLLLNLDSKMFACQS